MNIRWTEQAYGDLHGIREHISQDDPRAASSFTKALAVSAEKLVDFPLLGRKLPETDREDIRELLFGEYRIIYRVDAGEIWILTVIHGRRLLDSTILH
jgi:plasmid stabilization system protein ParE